MRGRRLDMSTSELSVREMVGHVWFCRLKLVAVALWEDRFQVFLSIRCYWKKKSTITTRFQEEAEKVSRWIWSRARI